MALYRPAAAAVAPTFTGAEVERVRRYARASKAQSTRSQYAHYFKDFAEWCAAHGATPLPALPETAVGYLTGLAEQGYALSTINQAASAIRNAHELSALPSPIDHGQVRATVDGIAKENRREEQGREPLYPEQLAIIRVAMNTGRPADVRDWALILVGWRLALRASEFKHLRIEDVRREKGAILLSVLREKTAKNGEADRKLKRITRGKRPESDPMAALELWLALLKQIGVASGPIFRALDRRGRLGEALSANAVNIVVRERARAAGLNGTKEKRIRKKNGDAEKVRPSGPRVRAREKYGAHSLRAGFVSTMRRFGKSYEEIMEITDHESIEMVKRYNKFGGAKLDNADDLGL